jgi:hypothetical protein
VQFSKLEFIDVVILPDGQRLQTDCPEEENVCKGQLIHSRSYPVEFPNVPALQFKQENRLVELSDTVYLAIGQNVQKVDPILEYVFCGHVSQVLK